LVTCFKTKPIDCILLARWEEGYSDPWLILTDLNPSDADISWYGFRSKIECSYRDIKSDGWQWHKTRLRNPERAERHWLAMAVALLWMLILGAEEESVNSSDRDRTITKTPVTEKTESENPSVSNDLFSNAVTRQVSCFVNGLLTILACLLKGESLNLGHLLPSSFNSFHHLAYSNSS